MVIIMDQSDIYDDLIHLSWNTRSYDDDDLEEIYELLGK